jgi:hypothetical protein
MVWTAALSMNESVLLTDAGIARFDVADYIERHASHCMHTSNAHSMIPAGM